MEPKNSYSGYRYSKEIISHVVWLYHRFSLSFRDIEDILAYRGIQVSYESIRQWCLKFGKLYARKLRKKYGKKSDMWFLDEVFITIGGQLHYLCEPLIRMVKSLIFLFKNVRIQRLPSVSLKNY